MFTVSNGSRSNFEHYWILATKKMICHWVSLFQTMQMLIISDCYVAEHGLWNAQSLKTHVMSYCSSQWLPDLIVNSPL